MSASGSKADLAACLASRLYPRKQTSNSRAAMSASLTGLLGSSAFRLSTTAVSMSLAGSRFSPESAAFFVKEVARAAKLSFGSFLVRS